jgi:hypothetical protein
MTPNEKAAVGLGLGALGAFLLWRWHQTSTAAAPLSPPPPSSSSSSGSSSGYDVQIGTAQLEPTGEFGWPRRRWERY